jgi:FXSXX-COOH protein
MTVAGQQPTGRINSGEDSAGIGETFSSAIIDLTDIDIAEVDRLPSSVLRAAVERVRAELAADEERTSYFQSSLPDTRALP